MKCQSKWNQQNAISNMSIGRHNEWNFVQEKIKKATQKWNVPQHIQFS